MDCGDRITGFADAFEGAFGHLHIAVEEACRSEVDWPAQVAAAIAAALELASAEPDAARVLVAEPLVRGRDASRRYLRMLEYFAGLLSAGAPADRRPPPSTPKALVGGIATMTADHLRAGQLDDLLAAAPELVEFTLTPYLGRAEARRWATH